jgi:hypothetical protein
MIPSVDSGHMSSISNSHLHATAWYLWDDAAQPGRTVPPAFVDSEQFVGLALIRGWTRIARGRPCQRQLLAEVVSETLDRAKCTTCLSHGQD